MQCCASSWGTQGERAERNALHCRVVCHNRVDGYRVGGHRAMVKKAGGMERGVQGKRGGRQQVRQAAVAGAGMRATNPVGAQDKRPGGGGGARAVTNRVKRRWQEKGGARSTWRAERARGREGPPGAQGMRPHGVGVPRPCRQKAAPGGWTPHAAAITGAAAAAGGAAAAGAACMPLFSSTAAQRGEARGRCGVTKLSSAPPVYAWRGPAGTSASHAGRPAPRAHPPPAGRCA